MTRRGSFAIATLALFVFVGSAGAQRASLAVGAALPVSDLSNTSGPGFDIDFQVRTEPMFGPVALRIDIGYDHFAAKNGGPSSNISVESISFVGDLGSSFYWMAGPGYYQANTIEQIDGHNVNEQRSNVGAQAAVGVNIPVFRWDGFLEAGVSKLFGPGSSRVYVPLRFGIRL